MAAIDALADPDSARILEGVRVLDFTQYRRAPTYPSCAPRRWASTTPTCSAAGPPTRTIASPAWPARGCSSPATGTEPRDGRGLPTRTGGVAAGVYIGVGTLVVILL